MTCWRMFGYVFVIDCHSWTRRQDSSTSLVEVTSDYAAHFYDMYVEGHTGKHLTGDRIRILLLNLSFVFRDLIAPEVMFPSTF